MANVQKYTKAAVGHLGKHYERGTGEDGNLVRFGNTDIQPHLSHLNYNLAPDHGLSHPEFIYRRTQEVKCLKRKDVNVMCSWVVTLPQGFSSDREREFFEQTYYFLENRYGGEKNVISAYVHKDEKQPHLHFAFVPVVTDKKKGHEKISAKEAVTKNDLETFHFALEKHLSAYFNFHVDLLNESTKMGNKSIISLKKETAKEELEDIALKTQKIASKEQEVKNSIKLLEKKKNQIQGKIEGLEKQLKGTKLNLEEITRIQPQKTILGAIKGITLKDIENLKKTAIMAIKAVAEKKELISENEKLREQSKNLESKIPSAMKKIEEAKKKSVWLEKANAFDRLPDDVKSKLLSQKDKSVSRNSWSER